MPSEPSFANAVEKPKSLARAVPNPATSMPRPTSERKARRLVRFMGNSLQLLSGVMKDIRRGPIPIGSRTQRRYKSTELEQFVELQCRKTLFLTSRFACCNDRPL